MMEKSYFCWHAGQTESDAKEVKAPSMEEAAKLAMDIWTHESLTEPGPQTVMVYVRDNEKHQKSFELTRDDSHGQSSVQ